MTLSPPHHCSEGDVRASEALYVKVNVGAEGGTVLIFHGTALDGEISDEADIRISVVNHHCGIVHGDPIMHARVIADRP
jgi:hypothetical protein